MIKASNEHLQSVDQSYYEHQGVAFHYAFKYLKAVIMAFIHVLIPSLFQTSASELVASLVKSRK